MNKASQIFAIVGFATSLLIMQSYEPASAEKKCGAESCGAPTKTTKTINGVVHNCDTTTCTKSCCTLADPPVCTVEKTTKSDCTAARTFPKQIEKLPKAPSAKQ